MAQKLLTAEDGKRHSLVVIQPRHFLHTTSCASGLGLG